jgi:hypothetical protein
MLAIKDRAKEKTREKYDTANFMLWDWTEAWDYQLTILMSDLLKFSPSIRSEAIRFMTTWREFALESEKTRLSKSVRPEISNWIKWWLNWLMDAQNRYSKYFGEIFADYFWESIKNERIEYLKMIFQEFEDTWTNSEVFINLFNKYLLPKLTSMNLPWVKKAKWLSNIMTKAQFKMVLNQLK